MENLSDPQLLNVIRQKQDYQQEAVAAAYAEINSREIVEADFEEDLADLERAREPLNLNSKIAFFLGSITIVPWLIRFRYRKDGYWLKYRNSGFLLKLGLVTYFGAYGIYLGYSSHPLMPRDIWQAFLKFWN